MIPKNVSKVVLVIDLQTAMFQGDPLYGADVLVKRVRKVLAWARSLGYPVCFIRHDGENGDPLAPGEPGWAVSPALGQEEHEPTFSKSVGDAFSQARLVAWTSDADEVILLGAQSDFCVSATALGAMKRGLKVTVVGDAHSTWPSAGQNAEEIIARCNSVFRTAGANVLTTDELVA
jgi:nicotinamidase-related amidase